MTGRRVFFAASLGAGMVALQGCGGGTTTTTTTEAPTPAPTPGTPGPTALPTPAPTPHPIPFTPGMSKEKTAQYLNEQWSRFDPDDDDSPLGVVMSMVLNVGSLFKNLYCESWDNPVVGYTKCYKGQADCRLSCSLVNHMVSVSNETGAMLPQMTRTTGFVVNMDVVKNFTKCSSIWDAASQMRLNNGCGNGGSGDCDDPKSPFKDLCDGQTCTAASDDVVRALCTQFGGKTPWPPEHDNHPQCLVPGRAINYHNQSDYQPGKDDNLRVMVKKKISFNNGKSAGGTPNIEMYNEVIIENRLFLPYMTDNPASAIVAFVYTKGNDAAHGWANQMAAEYTKVMKGNPQIPIIAIDMSATASTGGPFKVPDDADELVI